MPVADQFRFWAEMAFQTGSPLYAHLFARAAPDVDAGGVLQEILQPFQSEPASHVVPLRLAFQVHRWVLRGELPRLAAHYRSVGGTLPPQRAWPHFLDACWQRRDALQTLLAEPCQTNQVGRAAALIGGVALVARETGMPLRLLEIGSSAGLLLRLDRYRDAWWMPTMFEVPPPLTADLRVVERRGCDPSPVDPGTRAGELLLKACIWPDRLEELRMLEDAISVCQRVPAEIARADGADWLPERLHEVRPGLATVVFHSVTMMYPSLESRGRMGAALQRAACAATRETPLAWLRFEPAPGWLEEREAPEMEVRLSLWPDGDDRLLATADGDGGRVRWLAAV